VARRFGSTHVEELITPKQVAAELADIVGLFDEPFADSSAIPLHFLARMTRAHGVTVVLTGDGGDELFGGYETYLADQLLERFQRLPRWVQAVARRGVEALPVSHGKISLEQKLKRFVALSGWPPMVAHARWRAIFWAAELPDLLADGLGDGLSEAGAAELLVGDLGRLPGPEEGTNAFCWADTRYYLPADMLVKVDRVTMAHSLEARVPLLDERLVDFAFRLHPRLKLRGRTGKWLMREGLRGVVDSDVRLRPKAGFNVPMPAWIAGPLRELFRDVLAPTAVRRAGLVRPGSVERLLAEHEARQADHSFRLYALLALHLWLERWGRLQSG
jgi:asparagine synthase (glutamine-hydrolysing)